LEWKVAIYQGRSSIRLRICGKMDFSTATHLMDLGISAIEYVLPSKSLSVRELEDAGLLVSRAEKLQNFGFERCYISDESADELALRAAAALLDNYGIRPESVDLLLYAGAIASSHHVAGGHFLSNFNYPATKLQFELGLTRASVAGISQAGCMGLTYAVKFAGDFVRSNAEAQCVLCVSADVLPRGVQREILYNVISDGACALMVTRNSTQNRILAHRSVTKGYYWDCIARKNEILAAYFPTAKNLIQDLLGGAECPPEDLRMVLPHNVSYRSWEILLDLIGVRKEQLFATNISQKGHVIAADNWINLKDATTANLLNPGDKLLAFNFGFGANWAATLIEH
jgi:3-oxoacyl-[acyl-carrier-protein] synthase-3